MIFSDDEIVGDIDYSSGDETDDGTYEVVDEISLKTVGSQCTTILDQKHVSS